MQLNHVAVFVEDIDKASLALALGGWGGPVTTISKQPCTVAGRAAEHSGRTRRVRMAGTPLLGISVEDVAPGAPIQPVPGNPWHHLAVWCDDIPLVAAKLEQLGYRKEVVGRGPNGELATFAYMISDRGPRLELAEAAMRERMLEYFAKAAADAGESARAGLSAPLSPCEVAVVVEDTSRLDELRNCWQGAFAADWGEVTDHAMSVEVVGGTRELRFRSVSTSGEPKVTIIAPEPGSEALLAPVHINGWHHVGFRSRDMSNDIAWLEQFGFVMEFGDRGADGSPRSFAMMRAPEGTRVKLVASNS